jgi:hypothetical protein
MSYGMTYGNDNNAVKEAAMDAYVVFDGPPTQESGRFVEVEDGHGHGLGPSQTGAEWRERDDGWWELGPFANAREVERLKTLATTGEAAWVCEKHPDQPFPHDDCPGPGMLVPDAIRALMREAEASHPAQAPGEQVPCCHIPCDRAAEFEITDLADLSPNCFITQACSGHVGALLGHDIGLPDDAEDRWEVRALEAKQKLKQ